MKKVVRAIDRLEIGWWMKIRLVFVLANPDTY